MNETKWQFYLSSEEAWKGMLDSIKQAKHSIEIEQFYFTPDTVGREFFEVLIQKAKDGVKIRCLFDSVGSLTLSQSIYPDLLTKVGIEVRFFNWLFPFSQGNMRLWYFRDHRRSLIIDNEVAFTGGVCISEAMRIWRDTHVSITGSVVQQIRDAFEKAWDHVHHRTSKFSKESVMNMDGFTYSTHAPLPKQRYLYYRLIEAIRHARSHIYLTTPYFLPDYRMLRVLKLAKRRGVDVKILVPNVSNHSFVDAASRTYVEEILKNKIELYQYNIMIHAKTAVIDGDWSMIGSLNLDNVSLRYNFEAALVSTNKRFSQQIEAHFLHDITNAHLLTQEEWYNRSFFKKLVEFLIWPFRKLL